MALSATKLRQDIYRILDEILATGVPVEIERRGRQLEIVPKNPIKKLDRLVKRPIMACDPEDLVEMDWSGEWIPDP